MLFNFYGAKDGSTINEYMAVVTETSRPAVRGKTGSFSSFFYMFGIIIVNLNGKYFNMYETALIAAAITLFFLFAFSLMPDTPYYLLMKGKIDEAGKSLRFFRRFQNVDEELKTLRSVIKRQLDESRKYKDVFAIDSNRKALFLMSGRIFQQMTGSTAFVMYAQDLLSGPSEFIQPQFAVIIIYFLQTCATVFSGFFSDRCGRVPLLIFSTATCSVFLILIGAYFSLKDYPSLGLPLLCPVFLLAFYYIAFQIGIGTLIVVMLGELFSASIKPKAVCFVNIVYSLTVIISTKFYQISTDYWHPCVAPFFFAFCSLLSTFFIKKFYLEMNGKSLEEIQLEMKGMKKQEKATV